MRFRVFAVSLVALGFATATAAREQRVDGIAAQVGSSVVLHSEVVELSGPIENRLREAGRPEAEIQQVRSDALERLVEARLMEEVVRRLELGVGDAEVTQAIEGIAQDNGISVQQLTESVTSHGLTLAEYRAKIQSEIERSKVLNALVRSQVKIEPAEVQALYAQRYSNQRSGGEEIHLRHLVVMFREGLIDPASACGRVSEARDRMRSGNASFQQVAREISDSNAQRGGDMGWIHAEDVAAWMSPVIKSLGENEVSDVVETTFGCNLLQVVERRDFVPIGFEEAAPALEQELNLQKTEAEYVRWIDKMRGQTYIELKGAYAEASRLRGLDSPIER